MEDENVAISLRLIIIASAALSNWQEPAEAMGVCMDI